MTHKSRLMGVLDHELSRHLAFDYSISEIMTRPGSTLVQPKDRFRFSVWAVNNSGIGLADLRGMIGPTTLARFTPAPFELARLRPGERRLIATIEAEIVGNPGRRFVRLSMIGSVRVSACADLSEYRISKSTPLTYAPPSLTERKASA